eukprot:TRINITY_DN805_c0_g2_i1.p1 TRINITY_DN805_c0_g2~~TRINITY_DN805_c0_g2_i1.p1  ORF type:complete len:490 (-),score=87.65 TRINITY_DN805_c0_g2_i1:175-1644(-)
MGMIKQAGLLVLLLACCARFARGAPAAHLIVALPGLTDAISFKQYAGYITVDATNNRNLFYWFVESQRNPATDPVVLWTNGGPGASSLTGLFTEHGPFWPNPDGKTLFVNPYSWNRIANVIYLEDPVGVGFSYSDNKQDYTTNDNKTAEDNYKFLIEWMRLYPEYASNPLFLSGESYAGHYIPTLGRQILETDLKKTLNVKGIVLGNPFVNGDSFETFPNPLADAYPFITMLYTHGIIPVQAYAEASDRCGWANYLTDCANAGNYTLPTRSCRDALSICLEYVPTNYDVYDLNAPICLTSSPTARTQYVSRWNGLVNAVRDLLEKKSDATKTSGTPITAKLSTTDYDPCTIDYLNVYMNIPAVQAAVHAKSMEWSWFSSVLRYDVLDMYSNMIPIFELFFKSKWSVFIYSGDFDGCVPFIGTQRWINCLGRPIKEGWRSWNVDGQHAGSVITYDKITYLTVKGSGHMVPQYTPPQAWEMWSRWVDNISF